MTDATLGLLIDDTQAQLDAAFEALGAGGTVDLSDLPPRIETICRLAVESGAPEAADLLLALIERLDTLELTLRAVMTTAQALEPQADSRRVANSYRAVAESTGDSSDGLPRGLDAPGTS